MKYCAAVGWSETKPVTLTTSEGGLSAGTLFGLRPDVWKYIRGEMQKLISFHKSTADGNDHSSSIRPQQIHHSNDDRHCDSSSANDADVHNNKDDGGKQQRKTMQQQHSSAAIRTSSLADGVIVRWCHVQFIVVVAIGQTAATDDNDGE